MIPKFCKNCKGMTAGLMTDNVLMHPVSDVKVVQEFSLKKQNKIFKNGNEPEEKRRQHKDEKKAKQKG